jgi:hypothetical protein
MRIRRTWPVAAGLGLALASAPSSASMQTRSTTQNDSGESITLIGCVQREGNYRRTHDLGRGGAVGTGLGRGNEYVLINASAAGNAPDRASIDCSFEGSPETYELTGDRERELEPFVGKVVQISGRIKDASTRPVGTSGRTEPTGGFDPLGGDLRVREVELTSFQEVAASQPAAQPAQSQAPVRASEPPPAGPAPAAEQLPRTASPAPLMALIGLLSLGGALGLKRRGY